MPPISQTAPRIRNTLLLIKSNTKISDLINPRQCDAVHGVSSLCQVMQWHLPMFKDIESNTSLKLDAVIKNARNQQKKNYVVSKSKNIHKYNQ